MVPLSSGDFTRFVQFRVINAAEAAELLNCSRQYINELVKKKKLTPIKSSDKNTLFLKSDVLKRKWE
ncbi:MAG: helix-turn-helix domain-containing protein [Ruminiclostridium sp.]|nr:helix-turn-helix domain-containing protein [Ruminiclostridium sp.]